MQKLQQFNLFCCSARLQSRKRRESNLEEEEIIQTFSRKRKAEEV
jgi:hypothetical protein